eukprot:12897517-Prorocentrum_lima.AAC.1
MSPHGFCMNNSNTTWDIVDLMVVIVEIFIVETDGPGQDWRVELHIPISIQQTEAGQQVKSFKYKWVGIRSE